MDTIKLYVNYGCLAHEKKIVYTCDMPASTAVCSDKLTVKVPEGWEAYESQCGGTVFRAPWGWVYTPDEILAGDDHPCFYGINKDRRRFKVKLEVVSEN